MIRKRYSSKFKSEVALAALKEEKTLSELSSSYGLHASQIKEWKKKLKDSIGDIFSTAPPKKKNKADVPEESLYEEIGRLKIEKFF